MNLHRLEEIATSQLCAAVPEGFEAQIAGLVEMFLVEVNRRKLCQFTSSIKSKIRTHLAHMHETDAACEISSCPKMDQDENELPSMGDEANQENKENEENLAKNFLLSVYQMRLQNEYSLL